MQARHLLTAIALSAGLSATAQTTLWRLPAGFDTDRSLSYEKRYDNVDSIVMKARRMMIYSNGSRQSYTYPSLDAGERFVVNRPRLAVYKPGEQSDFNDPNSDYCYQRSMESEHFIVFWQKQFGDDPTQAPSGYAFNPKTLLDEAEKIYKVNTERLGFGTYDTSKTLSSYKGNLYVLYQTQWLATGSGYDNKIQAFWCNPTAVNSASTVGHEIGHTFQYVVYCDLGSGHGWREGFGPGGAGGNMFWESCAQWQAYQVYPNETFQGWYYSYPGYAYLNQLHEVPRYSNYFFQSYWCQLHGQDFIGRLWRSEVYPEDPIDAYKRITGISQSQYCDEMNDYARRAVTWDIDGLRDLGRTHRDAFTTDFHDTDDGWIEVDSSNCVQNYGFNVYRLKVPAAGTDIKVNFRGEAGRSGYRDYKKELAGWRYSFVALTQGDERVYSDIGRDSVGSLSFTVPTGTRQLWLVVSGAPKSHFHHEWNSTDDNLATGNADDEQWPYAFRMEGTDVQGHYSIDITHPHDTIVSQQVTVSYNAEHGFSSNIDLDMEPICAALGVKPADIHLTRAAQTDSEVKYYTIDGDTLSQKFGNQYTLSFYYNKEGRVINSTDSDFSEKSIAYMTTVIYYDNRYQFFFSEYGDQHLTPGQSVTFPLVFRRTTADGHTYTARVNIEVKVE